MHAPVRIPPPRQTINDGGNRVPSRPRRPKVSLCLLLFCLVISTGSGADILMLMNGIPGESTAYGHAGWMDVSYLSHGLSALPNTKAYHQEVSFTKRVDSATPLLYDRVNRGTVIPDVQIEFIGDSPTSLLFYKITLTGVQISLVTTAASQGDGIPSEQVSLFYKEIAWSYTQVSSPGMPNHTATWNRVENSGTSTNSQFDTDRDGMPNAYESANGLNPNVNDANGDLDRDSLTNYQEFLAGTNPNSANSVFRVTRINLASGQVRITWNSVAGKTYTISAASNVDGPYTPVRNVPSAGTGQTSADFPPSPARQFYRVATP